MEILDTNFERVLPQILEKPKEEYDEIDVTNLSQEIICELINMDYISGGFARINSNKVFVKVTYKGKNYFDNKKSFLKRERWTKIGEWVRYGITTAIALGALIVSIIAINK